MKISRLISICAVALSATVPLSALDLPVRNVNGTDYYYYEVKPKESIYSITRKLGVSREDIVRCNPAVVDGVRPKQLLLFPVAEFALGAKPEACPEEQPENTVMDPLPGRIVADNDNNSKEDEDVKESEDAGTSAVAVPDNAVSQDSTEIAYDEDEPKVINVGVMLPFMLDSSRMTKAAENYTEFYRGLLLAVDTIAGENRDYAINVTAYDTEGSVQKVMSLIERPEFETLDFIIAPEDSVCIERIAARADSTSARVINLFAVKNDAYLRHESVVQANIPQQMMYAKAIDGLKELYAGYTPVILTAPDIAADKAPFVSQLKTELETAGIEYKEISTPSGFTAESVADSLVAGHRYVFIPVSGSREMLARVLDPLIGLRETAGNPDDVRLFGYPEWIILRGVMEEKLHRLNTVIYSRFSADMDNYPTRRVMLRYTDWYGRSMNNTAPVYGLLGYDVMQWMFCTADSDISALFNGLQSTISVSCPSASGDCGMVNSSLDFMYFLPNGKFYHKSL